MSCFDDEVKVSVKCTAYNHGKYIRDALEGFVKQKTNFKFEVIVHDDASTDNTADIIREYEKKYPDIIKPIYQTENQYSKEKGNINKYISPKLKGKYLAFCEGDDYWTDENKLQMQYDIMEKYPQCPICVHKTQINDLQNLIKQKYIPNEKYQLTDGFISQEIQLDIALNDLFHLSSWFIRKMDYDKYISDKPEFAKNMLTGDKALMLYFVKMGNLYYIDKEMSTYRKGTEGSWTVRAERSKNKGLQNEHIEKMLTSMILYKDYLSKTEYNKILDIHIKGCRFALALSKKDFKAVLSKENREILKTFNKRNIIRFYICRFFPKFDDLWMFVKHDILKK